LFMGMQGDDNRIAIYIATWGDFKRWSRVTYKYGGETREASSSLKLIAEHENVDDILLFLPESLVVNLRIPPPKEDFMLAVELLKKECRDFVCHELGVSVKGKLIIRTLPSKGVFKGGSKKCKTLIEFDSNMADAKHVMYKYILDHILKRVEEKRRKSDCDEISLEVILDLTHSINYLPVLAYENVMKIMGILEIVRELLNLRLSLKVVNADPYVARNESQELSINVLYEVDKPTMNSHSITGQASNSSFGVDPYLPLFHPNDEPIISSRESKGILDKVIGSPTSSEVEEIIKYADMLSRAYHKNAPLVLITAPIMSIEERIESLVKRIISFYESPEAVNLHWVGDNELVIVRRKISLTETFHKLLSIYGFARLLSMGVDEIGSPPSLYSLENFAKKLYHRDEVRKAVVLDEVRRKYTNIANAVKKDNRILRLLSTYGDQYSKENLLTLHLSKRDVCGGERGDYSLSRIVSDRARLQKFKRHFLAHAGLLCWLLGVTVRLDERSIRRVISSEHQENEDKVYDDYFSRNIYLRYCYSLYEIYKYFLKD